MCLLLFSQVCLRSDETSQTLIALPVVVAFVADRFKMRGPMILICLPLNIIGNSRLIHCPPSSPTSDRIHHYHHCEVQRGSICCCLSDRDWTVRNSFTSSVLHSIKIIIPSYPCAPCILSIIPNNTSGHYKKATAVALQLGVANAG